ncbi:MAG: penicillin-binding protein [Candidatus Neomarinimicrobiota bacterium]|nr:penicillin-binding protein [Candidatus Neomarinimicrobiota bacterium]
MLSARLFQIMVIDSEQYKQQGITQAQKNEKLLAVRGNIYDRNNVPLTQNIIHYSLGAQTFKIKDRAEFAAKIANSTGRDIEYYLKKIDTKKSFVVIEHKLRQNKVQPLLEQIIPGLVIERKSRRYYPQENIASQTVGFTDVDDKGLTGIEKEFNSYLAGKAGWVVKQVDGKGRSQIKTSFPIKPPIDGSNIQLTIDLEYQSILHEELNRRINETNAKGAIGIIINPQNGSILAMSSMPDFNPNQHGLSPIENQKNRVLTDQFEPGSTYKVVTATAAVATNAVSLYEEFNCKEGKINVAGKIISDHEIFGLLTFPQIIAHSSNVGMIKIAQKLGQEPLYTFSRDFGFGSPTGIQFPGESKGKLRQTKYWSEMSLAEISIGYEVGVTALQLASAYAAIANGGYLIKPSLIKQILSAKGEVIYSEKPEIIRKIANPEIMETVKDMLVDVVQYGTGEKAKIKGWSIAGKTGTAYKFIDGAYSNKYISNFAGFFPAEKPQVVGVIILDEPKYGYHWGGYGAAPVFRRIAQRIINVDDSIKHHKKEKRPTETVIANNDNEKSLIALSTVNSLKKYQDGYAIVPNVRGMSIRKAKSILKKSNLRAKFEGSGQVVWQSPAPGTKKLPGTICTIGLN